MNSKRFKRKLNRIRQKGEQYKKEQAVRDAYAKYWPEHKRRKTSNIMLVVSVLAILIYTIASFWLQYRTGIPIDPTLTTLYYGFWTCEVFVLAGIKISKVIKPSSSDEACG